MSALLLVALPPLSALVAVLDSRAGTPVWLLFCVVLAQSAALAWSRRFPLTVLVVVAALEVVLVARDLELLVGFLAAACALGAWGGRWQQRVGLAFGFGLLGVGLVLSVGGGNRPGVSVAGLGALAALFAGFWSVGRLSAGHLRRLVELNRYSRRLEAERALAERRAADRERVLLARELHDILNHAVTAMVLDADAAVETGDDTESRAALRRVAATGRQSLGELRRLLAVLRATGDGADHDPLAVLPGLSDVDSLLRHLPEGGPRVRLERLGTPRPLDASVGQAAYRVVQESLTNVIRHAGSVDTRVCLEFAPGALTVRVANAPGRTGVPGSGGGLGLVGMRERVELVGGTLAAGPGADGGFEVRATFPVRDAG
ncbi:hypothetical protein Val02_29700 [Virgisporangium aliadipatigenens]|uniref:histidine kinase n=1 Tax=Virgisporangium aliadipatigenens TaxID=741659 RepID=A0A8J3YIT2_9ACTN|nr:histidine kinase [Virgisporangium aliadipatigenens]GIJ46084.1 hypothetical protein Val02_29700 [Virgisporangium aliadipatigenens]